MNNKEHRADSVFNEQENKQTPDIIDEEKMKKFDELHQKALEANRAAYAAREEFFEFVDYLHGVQFKEAKSDKKCQIRCIQFPSYRAFSGFVSHKRLNFGSNHWWNPHVNSFRNFCDAIRCRKIVLIKNAEEKNGVEI